MGDGFQSPISKPGRSHGRLRKRVGRCGNLKGGLWDGRLNGRFYSPDRSRELRGRHSNLRRRIAFRETLNRELRLSLSSHMASYTRRGLRSCWERRVVRTRILKLCCSGKHVHPQLSSAKPEVALVFGCIVRDANAAHVVDAEINAAKHAVLRLHATTRFLASNKLPSAHDSEGSCLCVDVLVVVVIAFVGECTGWQRQCLHGRWRCASGHVTSPSGSFACRNKNCSRPRTHKPVLRLRCPEAAPGRESREGCAGGRDCERLLHGGGRRLSPNHGNHGQWRDPGVHQDSCMAEGERSVGNFRDDSTRASDARILLVNPCPGIEITGLRIASRFVVDNGCDHGSWVITGGILVHP
jgi:hypothetical protein